MYGGVTLYKARNPTYSVEDLGLSFCQSLHDIIYSAARPSESRSPGQGLMWGGRHNADAATEVFKRVSGDLKRQT